MRRFQRAEVTKFKRLVLNLEAEDKEGKTEFGLSAPGPLAIINLDIGAEGVIDKWIAKGKEIMVADFNVKDASDPIGWAQMWDDVKGAYIEAVKDKDTRTVVCDTATEMWELIRLARFGKLSSPGEQIAHWYGPLNAEFRDLIKRVYDTDKNLVLLHKMKDKWIKNQRTGEKERAGFGDIAHIVQANLLGWYREGTFGITIRNCRQNMELAGMDLVGEMSNFPFLATLIYPDTSEEDWT